MGKFTTFKSAANRLMIYAAVAVSLIALSGCKSTTPPNPKIAAVNRAWLKEKVTSGIELGLGDKSSWRIYKSCIGDTQSWLKGCFIDNYYSASFAASKLKEPVPDFCKKAFAFLDSLEPATVSQLSYPEYGVTDSKSGLEVCQSKESVTITAHKFGGQGKAVWNITIQNILGKESIGIDLRSVGGEKSK